MATSISYSEESWEIITGCSGAGTPGCINCYSKKIATRLKGKTGFPSAKPFTPAIFHQDQLDKPLSWDTPRRVIVSNIGDICDPNVRFEHFKQVIDVIIKCEREKRGHIFQILTKKPNILKDFMREIESYVISINTNNENPIQFPLPNLWLGVSAENQQCADVRIPVLLDIPAEIHFLYCEPLLSEIDLSAYIGNNSNQIDWVIAGGEIAGQKARKTEIAWLRNLRDQSISTDVAFYFKGWGNFKHDPVTNDYEYSKDAKKAGNVLDNQTWEQFPY